MSLPLSAVLSPLTLTPSPSTTLPCSFAPRTNSVVSSCLLCMSNYRGNIRFAEGAPCNACVHAYSGSRPLAALRVQPCLCAKRALCFVPYKRRECSILLLLIACIQATFGWMHRSGCRLFAQVRSEKQAETYAPCRLHCSVD